MSADREGALLPHDLLWFASPRAYESPDPLPAWASREWLGSAPAVVRRASRELPARIPVGLRGRMRHQRHAAWVDARDVIRRVAPEALARSRAWQTHPQRDALPCLRMLERIAPMLDACGLTWGITGSVGFTLASGLFVLRQDSDLDLLLRLPRAMSAGAAANLLRALAALNEQAGEASRIDVQADTGHGAFSLAEWAAARGAVLLKTDCGPVLRDDPWATPARPRMPVTARSCPSAI
ncbi:hypothetical protein ABW99_07505 [Pandoraea thiooxydans]|uniref:Phosphoribosyl-dephospho-CoA transferase n=1 Tax=Pandoraea thiooxydans TaxID=445709 RepID=A0A0G3F0D3_9BURK|nr:hypothetical protein ABW99_07505 [Pandoraea thiooxydans]